MKIKKVGSKSTYLIIIGVIIIIGLVFYFDKKNNTENTMPIATILMSLAATVTFLYTIEKNKESKEQFEQERNEVKAQFEEQQKFFQKQQFESTFFNMLKLQQEITNELEFRDRKGRILFFKMFEDMQVFVNKEEFIDLMGNRTDSLVYDSIRSLINELGVKGYKNINHLPIYDHYFRHLYRIMTFIDESTFLDKDSKYIDERYRYASILRATLSPYELVFLFYNGLVYENFKALIEKYSLLNNLRRDLTANNIYVEETLTKREDKFKFDKDRFQTEVEGDKTKYYISAFEKDSSLFII